MPWWIWIAAGLALALLEVLFSSGEFYLLLVGVAALCVGVVGLAGLDQPWLQLLVFSLAATLSLLLLRPRLSGRLKAGLLDREVDSLVNERARAVEALPVGGEGKVELRGTSWNARNVAESEIPADARCKVEKVDGLTLWVRPE